MGTNLVGPDEPIGQRDAVRQQLVDDTAAVLSAGRRIPVQEGGQQAPGLVCGAAAPRKHVTDVHQKDEARRDEAHLDSLVLTTDDSWLAANQVQASF